MSNVVIRDEESIAALPAGFEQHGSLAVSLARAEVDQQIATARAMPRSITRAVQNITALATLDDASAEECIYALPRAGKPIKGPSVRLAEIIASQWGNCRVGARVVHVDRHEKYVEAEGVFHDLETNTATTARVRRRISDNKNRLLTEDMIVVTGNAAASIAKRNAILGGVPKAVWRRAYDAVESVITGDIKTLVERRGRAVAAFKAFGVTPEQVFDALGVAGEDDVGLEHLSTLTAMRAALKNGEATVEEMFPKPEAKATSKTLAEKLDSLAQPTHDPETGEIKSDRNLDDAGETAGAAPETPAAPADAAGEGQASGPAAKPRGEGGAGRQPSSLLDEFPGDRPMRSREEAEREFQKLSLVEIARARGEYARGARILREAVPTEYSGEERRAEAVGWLAGWDSKRLDAEG